MYREATTENRIENNEPIVGGRFRNVWHDTSTWNEGPDTIVAPGSETYIGGEFTNYGLEGRAVLLLIAK